MGCHWHHCCGSSAWWGDLRDWESEYGSSLRPRSDPPERPERGRGAFRAMQERQLELEREIAELRDLIRERPATPA